MTAPDVRREALIRMRSVPPPQERHETYGDFAKAFIVAVLLVVAGVALTFALKATEVAR